MIAMGKKRVGISVIFILVIFPMFLWSLMMPLASRFGNFDMTATSLGEISGLLGMVLLTITIILSGRFKFMEPYFGGLDRIYFWHHFLGGIALISLLFHPIILAIRFFGVSLHEAAVFLSPGNGAAMDFGILGLLFLIILLIFTFFIKFPYKTWKITHKFLGVVFILAILHTFLIQSDVSMYWLLKIYMGILVLCGLGALFYRTIFGNILPKKFTYSVDEIKKLNGGIVEITMSARGERMGFKAGQYIFISFKNGGVGGEIHPFSISSSGSDKNLKIIVKSLGKYTARIQNLKLGATARVEGPFGIFSYTNTSNKNQIWIAGGIGITPFLGMARSLSGGDYKIDLYYCAKNSSEMVFLSEMEKISMQNKNFRIIKICSDTRGRLGVQTINALSGSILEKDFFLCGPLVMMKSMRKALLENGVPNKSIHSEEFNF